MREFFKPTVRKIVTVAIFLFLDNSISFGWPEFSFYDYTCYPISMWNARLYCGRLGLNWVKLVVAIILFYILACLIGLIPKKILKFITWIFIAIILVGFVMLFIGGIKF